MIVKNILVGQFRPTYSLGKKERNTYKAGFFTYIHNFITRLKELVSRTWTICCQHHCLLCSGQMHNLRDIKKLSCRNYFYCAFSILYVYIVYVI